MRGRGHMSLFSATCCGEPLFLPKLPIVHLLTARGHYQDARKPKRYMRQATWQPIYIYIKDNTIHNNKREKSGQCLL